MAREVRQAAAREWTLWEMATSKLIPDSKVSTESFFLLLFEATFSSFSNDKKS